MHHRMTEEELRAFVNEYCDGRIFTSLQVRDQRDIPAVFMPLAFGVPESWTPAYLAELGVLWERLEAAGPRSYNGMPTFFSLRVMHKDDWARAALAIDNELKRRKEIVV